MWDAISAVGTPITLIAFVVAVLATIYRVREQSKVNLIKSASEEARASLIDKSLETYNIRKDNLTRQQKYDLMMEVIQRRDSRLKILAGTSIVIAIILAAAIVLLAAFNQPPVQPDHEDNLTPIPTANKPPVIVHELMAFDDGEIPPLTYRIQQDTSWSEEAAQGLIRASALRNVILEADQPAFDAHFIIRNTTDQTIQLTLSPDYFSLEDTQGQVAKRIYFCCAAEGSPMAPGQEREVRVVFENMWSGIYKESTPDARLIVRGLFPVTEASWGMPFLLAASR